MKMATLSPNSKSKNLREPPPSLFLGPPSHNASQISISAPIPSLGFGKGLPGNVAAGTGEKDFGRISGPDISNPLPLPPRPRHVSETQKQADRTDALWAEMQSTLEEVDLSASYNIAGTGGTGASNGGIHVFGPEHAKVLEELRSAQMELAKAWARSEVADEEEERRGVERNEKENLLTTGLGGKIAGIRPVPSDTGRSHPDQSHAEIEASYAGKSTAQTGSGSGPGVRTGEAAGSQLMEEETKSDILLARKRREANDKYFKRVNEGVLDVVGKLEEVARAMGAVERESRDIWGEDGDSVIDGSASVVSAEV